MTVLGTLLEGAVVLLLWEVDGRRVPVCVSVCEPVPVCACCPGGKGGAGGSCGWRDNNC